MSIKMKKRKKPVEVNSVRPRRKKKIRAVKEETSQETKRTPFDALIVKLISMSYTWLRNKSRREDFENHIRRYFDETMIGNGNVQIEVKHVVDTCSRLALLFTDIANTMAPEQYHAALNAFSRESQSKTK